MYIMSDYDALSDFLTQMEEPKRGIQDGKYRPSATVRGL